jgi:hypothetical protein
MIAHASLALGQHRDNIIQNQSIVMVELTPKALKEIQNHLISDTQDMGGLHKSNSSSSS